MTNYETERKYKGDIICPFEGSNGAIWSFKLEDDLDFWNACNTLADAKEEIDWMIENNQNY